jgi:hypothetical protein
MATWEYKVAYIDFRGFISSEGLETRISNERHSTFARRYLDSLGREGWELTGVQPLTTHTAYYIFKRPFTGESARQETPAAGASAQPTSGGGPTIEHA